ncbi:hypothetical protein BC830DRAFT_1167232 [Chytriomyces sp. MP71]|nr:hypothetical protein BC830DRAFT_1167232 [Chytriomyces sp. MP71]
MERTADHSSIYTNIEISACAVYAVSLPLLAGFIIYETRRPLTWKSMGTPFNILLSFMGLSALCIHVFMIESYLSETEPNETIIDAILQPVGQEASIYATISFYIQCSWTRGSAVMREVFPKIHSAFRIMIHSSVIVVVVTVATSAAQRWFTYYDEPMSPSFQIFQSIIQCLPGVLFLTIDTVILVTFTSYLRRTVREAGEQVDNRFLIISRYGIAVTMCAFGSYALYVTSLFGTTSIEMGQLTFAIMVVFIDAIFFILFSMKVALFFEKQRKEAKRQEIIAGLKIEIRQQTL